MRIDCFIEDAAPGQDKRRSPGASPRLPRIRRRAVKHLAAGDRQEAGIAADPVILLANILRRMEVE